MEDKNILKNEENEINLNKKFSMREKKKKEKGIRLTLRLQVCRGRRKSLTDPLYWQSIPEPLSASTSPEIKKLSPKHSSSSYRAYIRRKSE